jgi:hypothetical protein
MRIPAGVVILFAPVFASAQQADDPSMRSGDGMTGGFSAAPPLYCPDAPLTRGQMAIFLSLALGLHSPN